MITKQIPSFINVKDLVFSGFRKRCQVVLLSHKRLTTSEIVRVKDLSTLTVYKVPAKWRKYGIIGLIRRKGQGRKPRLVSKYSTLAGFAQKLST